jgi:hypothetical protein
MLIVVGGSRAFGWGSSGHETVGAIADQLVVGTNAASQVKAILGDITLSVAAGWPDCVRSVKKGSNGTFTYDPVEEYRPPCLAFEEDGRKARMEDYAKRNWSNCASPPQKGCHTNYHFADVATQHDRYDRSFVGTADDDIVSAMGATIAVLQGKPAPAPFDIKDKQEALLMLAHFVGDAHQPLHVGAVYLDPTGKRIDPDAGGHAFDPKTATHGGNSILDDKMNLHSEWDATSRRIHPTAPSASMLSEAKAVPVTPGDVSTWPSAWATDTVLASHKAFSGVSFTRFKKTPKGYWQAIFQDPTAYTRAMRRLQSSQLAKAGARLAQTLNAIWP